MNEIHGKSILVQVSEGSSYQDSTVSVNQSDVYMSYLNHCINNVIVMQSIIMYNLRA